jgi:hypothetical protein
MSPRAKPPRTPGLKNERPDWHSFFTPELNFHSVMPSSVVAEIRYDSYSSTLRVIYVSGMVYDYKNVPAHVYTQMKNSFAKGTFLNQHIKGKYPFEKVGG